MFSIASRQGNFKPRIDRVLPLVQIVQAHCYMESNEQIGKIVLTVHWISAMDT